MLFTLSPFFFLHLVCDSILAADFVFLLDTSSGVGKANFAKMQEFVSRIVENFDMDSLMSKFSVITYDTQARLDIKLSDFSTETAFLQRLNELEYGAGKATRIDFALVKAKEEAFSIENGARDNVKKVW